MNIILIFTYGVSLKDWSETGILKRELEIYNKMTDLYDVKFTFITYGNKEDIGFFDNKNIEIIPIYKYVKKYKNKYLRFLMSFIFPFRIRKILIDKSLIKTNQLNGVWIGIILKKLLKIPLFVRTGYNLYEFSIYEKKSKIKRFFFHQLTKIALKASDLYSVTSNQDKKFLEKNFKFDKEIKLIPNWVNKISYKDFNDRHCNNLLTVGRIEDQKNYKLLIDQLKKTDYELDLIGDGSRKNELKNYSKELNSKVNFLGKKAHEDLIEFYKNYRIFISSSLYEGNSKVILEAMASGCVVVAFDNKNNREIISDEKNGFLYTTENELISKINKVITDEKLYEFISKNGYEQIKNNNLLKKIVLDEIEYYKFLIQI